METRERIALLCSSFILALLVPLQSLAKPVRTVETDEGTVADVRTALGYSTILEFQAKPLSAVLGDQDAFRLEYVGNSITIKPLLARARSNVFIFTEYGRFNCRLVTVPSSEVDYIVRIRSRARTAPIERPGESRGESAPASSFAIRPLHRSKHYQGFTLRLLSMSQERDLTRPRSVTLIDFELSSKKEAYSFRPGAISVSQDGVPLNVESLYLERTELDPGLLPLRGKIALLSKDFKPTRPITVSFAFPGIGSAAKPRRIQVSSAAKSKAKPLIDKASDAKGG